MSHGIDTGFLVAAEVLEHPNHLSARQCFSELRAAGDSFALVPQVLAEFIHVVTDPKRFRSPLPMDEALERAEAWWRSHEIIGLFECGSSIATFFQWMHRHRLGRKRILDTKLAAVFREAGIASVLTTNPSDFRNLGGFSVITPS